MHRREDLYAGPELDKIPDLVVEFRDYAWLGKGNLTERTPALEDRITIRAHPDQRYAGGHRQDGIFVLAGPDARARRGAGRRRDRRRRADRDVPARRAVPAAFEGRLLAEAIEPSLLDERPPEFDDDEEPAPVLAEHDEPARGRGAAT